MPRDGSGVMSKPAGTTAVPNTVVASAPYNATIDDLINDANFLRPVTAGGTGVATLAELRMALGLSTAAVSAMDARRNRIVNGDMAISQENGNTIGTVNGYYPADQFALFFTTTGAGRSIQRVQARTLAGSLNQLEYKCTTAKGSLSAGDSEMISQNLEGSNVADCAFGTALAKPFVDRFQVQLPAGTYHMHYSNSASNRHCAVPFVVTGGEANTAVVKSVVVTADTGGTWLTAEGVIGMTRDLILAAGSTFTGGSASTWGATMYFAATTQANILSNTSNVARLADVGLRLDPDATGVYGQYEAGETDEAYRSERYGWSLVDIFIGFALDTSNPRSPVIRWPVPMAKIPTAIGVTFFVASGSPGTFTWRSISTANPTRRNGWVQNGSNNWDISTSVTFSTGFLSARLS